MILAEINACLYPPKVLDDIGIHFEKEYVGPKGYKKAKCDCGKIHQEYDDTWYYSCCLHQKEGNRLHSITIIKRCRGCNKALMLESAEHN